MNNTPSIPLFHKAVEGLKYLFLVLLAMVFLVELGLSLMWQIETDGSALHYFAYLINEHGFVPYRDIFDPNMPGTYLFHMAVGKLFGYSDLAFRLVDVVWLTAIFIVTWLIMKPFGRVAASASCLLFGLIYLGAGPYMSLQREFIAILPMATALWLATRRESNQSGHRTHFLCGVLFALAALIKPHLVIGLPALIVYSCIHNSDDLKSIQRLVKSCFVGCIFALIGFLAVLVMPFLWLWQIGALESFLDIFSSYTPLYRQMSRGLEFRSPFSRLLNMVYWYIRLGGFGILLTACIFGVHLVLTRSTAVTAKRLAIFLLLLALLYTIYVAIGGRFLDYHWMPFVYFTSLGTALALCSASSLVPACGYRPDILPTFGFIVTAIAVTLLPAHGAANHLLYNKPPVPFHYDQVLEITEYLDEHLSPTDTVQPLDWNGGALHAMRITKAVLATPYIFDFQFYHHVSTPYIQSLRQDFLIELVHERPTFIIDVYRVGDDIARVSGIDTTRDFPELREFIAQYYEKDYAGKGFDMYRRNDN